MKIPSTREDLIIVSHPVPATRTERQVLERSLHPSELALLSERATEKRRSEFVAGRMAAREALSLLLGQNLDPILRDERGRPISAGAEISITHADGLAVAAAARFRMGIDLVSFEELSDAFSAEAFSPGELRSWEEWSTSEGIEYPRSIAFSAKEAVLKWMGTGFSVPLQSIAICPARTLLRMQRILLVEGSLLREGQATEIALELHLLQGQVLTICQGSPPATALRSPLR